MQKQINQIRKNIDKIDKKIIDLLETRLNYVKQVATFKETNKNISYIKADREYNMVKSLQEYSNLIPKEIIFQIWRNIISFSLFSEHAFKIYVVGSQQDFNNSLLLIKNYFSDLPEIIYYNQDNLNHKKDILKPTNIIVGKINNNNYIEILLSHKFKIFAKLNNIEKQNYYSASLIPKESLVNKNHLFLTQDKHKNYIDKVVINNQELFITHSSDINKKDVFLGSYT